jgi:hypothetical protein
MPVRASLTEERERSMRSWSSIRPVDLSPNIFYVVLDLPAFFVVSVKGFVSVHHPRPEYLPAIPAKIVQLLVELDILMSRYVVILPASLAFMGFVHGVVRFLPISSHVLTKSPLLQQDWCHSEDSDAA